ncbi:MAG: hypothetical protein AB7C97_11900, partial [Oscillospiraceae bacterium]
MKKALVVLLAVCMVFALFAGCAGNTGGTAGTADSGSGNKVVKIGVYEPASGDNGAGGKQETLGIQYANDICPTVDIGGETYDVELVTVDNESSTDKAASAANDMIAAVSAMGYDAYFVALEALKAAGSTDPVAVNEALWNVEYTGVSGQIVFNETGDAIRDVAYVKCVDTAAGT